MTDREKLIELLDAAHDEYYKHFDMSRGYMATLADHLIANGVTFAKDTDAPSKLSGNSGQFKWISVEDGLPDLVPCNAGTAYSEAVIVWTSGEKAMVAVWDGTAFLCAADYWGAWGETITHWMPLPKPPKEI